jgi:hypothetical protein
MLGFSSTLENTAISTKTGAANIDDGHTVTRKVATN